MLELWQILPLSLEHLIELRSPALTTLRGAPQTQNTESAV
jgi:hypothetical protein